MCVNRIIHTEKEGCTSAHWGRLKGELQKLCVDQNGDFKSLNQKGVCSLY